MNTSREVLSVAKGAIVNLTQSGEIKMTAVTIEINSENAKQAERLKEALEFQDCKHSEIVSWFLVSLNDQFPDISTDAQMSFMGTVVSIINEHGLKALAPLEALYLRQLG